MKNKKIENKVLTCYNLPATLLVNIGDAYRIKLFSCLESKFHSRLKICATIGCSLSSFKNYKRRGRFIPANIFKTILKVTESSESEANNSIFEIKKRLCGKSVGVKLPICLSENLVELIGHSIGDGHISENGRFVYVNKEKELIEKVKNLVNLIFNREIYFDERISNMRYSSLHYPSAIGEILSFFGGIKGNKTYQNWNIPAWIIKGRLNLKKYFSVSWYP